MKFLVLLAGCGLGDGSCVEEVILTYTALDQYGCDYTPVAEYPQVDTPMHSAAYEQETKLDLRYRAELILSKLIADNDEHATIAVVTHGGMIGQLYQSFLRLPLDLKYRFPTGDTGIHEWDIIGENRVVVRANYIAHDV